YAPGFQRRPASLAGNELVPVDPEPPREAVRIRTDSAHPDPRAAAQRRPDSRCLERKPFPGEDVDPVVLAGDGEGDREPGGTAGEVPRGAAHAGGVAPLPGDLLAVDDLSGADKHRRRRPVSSAGEVHAVVQTH